MDINSISPEILAGLPKGKVEVVYAFILGFTPDIVIAIESGGKYRLPGGVVEGIGEPSGCTDGQHFQPLVWHVKEQTGLDLVGISRGIAVRIFEGELGPSVSVLYVGKATGKQTAGRLVSIDAIPSFDPICSVSTDQIQSFLQTPTVGSRVWHALKSVLRM